MRYLLIVLAALVLTGSANATSRSAGCCNGGKCCVIKAACCKK